MIFGTRLPSAPSPGWALLLAGCMIGVAAQGVADDRSGAWTVEHLAASVKAKREPSVAFEEEMHSSLLAKPLVTRGILRFTPPSRLEKEVREPYRERYVVEGDLVTIESERRSLVKTISLDEHPGLRRFVETFQMLLDGDAARMARDYETSLEGTRSKWVLRLRPRDRTGAVPVDIIELSGSDGRIDRITVRASDGDRWVMTLSPGPLP